MHTNGVLISARKGVRSIHNFPLEVKKCNPCTATISTPSPPRLPSITTVWTQCTHTILCCSRSRLVTASTSTQRRSSTFRWRVSLMGSEDAGDFTCLWRHVAQFGSKQGASFILRIFSLSGWAHVFGIRLSGRFGQILEDTEEQSGAKSTNESTGI
ncbi:unnamed protein product [Durusdinium trenchii]|uniref:Uncharacterized protein n=1 Tax=Durusdinium trenchii TaxID=1381693 RepID=A0ABP0Q538_9DINO